LIDLTAHPAVGVHRWGLLAFGFLIVAPAIIKVLTVNLYPLVEGFRLRCFAFTGLHDR